MKQVLIKLFSRFLIFFVIVTVLALFLISSLEYNWDRKNKDILAAYWVQNLYGVIRNDVLDVKLLKLINPELLMQQANQAINITITDNNHNKIYSFSTIFDEHESDIRSFPIISNKMDIATVTIRFPDYKWLNAATVELALLFSCLPSFFYCVVLWYNNRKRQRSLLEICYLLETASTNQKVLNWNSEELIQNIKTGISELTVTLDNLKNISKNMVADFAHELRTPISIIRVKLESRIENQEILSTEEMYLLLEELYRITKMIKDLQNLSLAESGNLTLNKIWFSLQELIEHILELLEAYADDKGIEVVLKLEQHLSIYADRDYIKQVFMNLIYNALQHSSQSIIIEGRMEGAMIFVKLIDDGDGIELEEMPYVFERFYRSRESNNSNGMGLGLAIARSLLSAHTGSVEVESIWGEGSTFIIKLPVFKE